MADLQDLPDDAIVISGISGAFPKSDNIYELRRNLIEKRDCMTASVDHKRWNVDHPDVPSRLGSLNNIEKFDRVYFAVHKKLADKMEPTSRILLEHSVAAVIDAGINPDTLKGRNIAVYVNSALTETEQSLFARQLKVDGFGIMGSSKAMMANRISFSLDLKGSSTHIDAGSAGAIVLLENVAKAIKNDECEAAIIAGGVLCLLPEISLLMKHLGILSVDTISRSFDDNASGHVRSEGVTAMYVQKAKYAKRIYMEVLSARAAYLDSYNINGFLYPHVDRQVELMKQVLNDCGLTPDDIAYLEATGMAIKNLDEKELEAIDRVYGKRKEPLYVGSIISNLGYAVPVNAFNGIIKMILGMENKTILPNMNYEKPNSKALGLTSGRIRIPTEVTPVKGQYVAINTISEVGLFGSAILRCPNIEKAKNDASQDGLPRIVALSGRTEASIESMLQFLETNPVDVELCQMINDIYESGIDKHMHKGFTVLPASGLLNTDLRVRESMPHTGMKHQVWWVFSGMGSQWPGMGTELLKIPVFKESIQRCADALKPHGYDIYKIITDKDPKMFDNIIHSFVGIAAIQIGLVDVLKCVGLEPDFIIGHSVGELGCAYADGSLTAEQMILAALSRGLASKEAELIPGAMAAVGLGYQDVKPLCPPDIDVACHNGPDSSTISGPAESMRKFVASLTARGIFAREVASSGIAYHSRYIAPAGPKLLQRLQEVIPTPKPRSEKWISTSIPKEEWKSIKARLCSAEYHTNNLLSPVLFEEMSRQIPAGSICVEIAPHGLLQAILKKSLSKCTNIPMTRRGHHDNSVLVLQSIGKMYNLDLNPKISNLYPKMKYPVGTGTQSLSPFIKWDHTTNRSDVLLDEYKTDDTRGEKVIEIDLNKTDDHYLKSNTINGQLVTPLLSCLKEAWNTIETWKNPEKIAEKSIRDVVFEDIKMYKPLLTVPDDKIVKISIITLKGTGRIEIVDRKSNEILAQAIVKSIVAPSQQRYDIQKLGYQKQEKYEINHEDFYTEMEARGSNYSKAFKTVLKTTADGSAGLVRWENDWVTFIDGVLQLYAFDNDTRHAYVPLTIRKIVIDSKKHQNEANNSKEINVTINKNLNYISAGGVEIQGLQYSTLPVQHEQIYTSNDVIAVVPNTNNSSTPLSIILRLVLQIITENSFSDKLQRIEIVRHSDSQNIKSLQKALLNVPEIRWFKQDICSLKSAELNNILIILTGNLGNYNLEEISNSLKKGKFILVALTSDKQDSYLKTAAKLSLKVVFSRKTENEVYVLLRKTGSSAKTRVINITENIKKSVDTIAKSAKNLPDNERVAVLVKSNETNASNTISEILNQLEVARCNLDKVRLFLVNDAKLSEDLLSNELYRNQLDLDLFINVLTSQKLWATLRRTPVILREKLCETWSANRTISNMPLSIRWTEGRPFDTVGNLVQVEYSTINPQDLLIANGSFYIEGLERSRIEQIGIGLEFSGIDKQLNRVMGITCGNSMANFVNVDPTWMWTIPKTWSFEDAATVPLSYLVAYSALVIKAEAKANDSVLITNVSDGVSLAAITLALYMKCDVFVSYEKEAEEKLIKGAFPQIPANRLLKSTSSNSFRDNILFHTKGEGVNIVIANQSEVNQLDIFFTAVKRQARAVVISDLNESEIHGYVGMQVFLKELNFYSVVPKTVLLSDVKSKKTLAYMLQEGINNGSVKPLPRTVYYRESLPQAVGACLKKENLGKIVVKVAEKDAKKNEALAIPRLYCADKKSYLIIEGLTGAGLELIDWLITRGARQLVVASNLKVDNGYQRLRLKNWQSNGVKINLHTETDLSQQQNVKALIKEASSLGPVDAIFDMRRTDVASNKQRVPCDASALTTKILDKESRSACRELRYFVVCSAVRSSAVLTKAQESERYTHTSLEQKSLDEIIAKRKKDRLPGLIIRLGLLAGVSSERLANVYTPAVGRYLLQLDEILGTDENIVDISYYAALADEVEVYVDIGRLNELIANKKMSQIHMEYLTNLNCTMNDLVRKYELSKKFEYKYIINNDKTVQAILKMTI